MQFLGVEDVEHKPLLAKQRTDFPRVSVFVVAIVLFVAVVRFLSIQVPSAPLLAAAPAKADSATAPGAAPGLAAAALTPLELRLEATAEAVLRADRGLESDAQGVHRWLDHRGRAWERYRPHSDAFRYVPPRVGTTAGRPVLNFHHGSEDVTGLVFTGLQLPQPLTLVVVANAAGDSTLLANAPTGVMPHVALCHGWSKHGFQSPRIALTASGGGPDPLDPPERIVYGRTRDARAWHVYSAVLDTVNSRLFVDGALEGSGMPGSNGLEGLMVGADQFGQFGLQGGVFEVWVFAGVLPEDDRTALEQRLLTKYADAMRLPPTPH